MDNFMIQELASLLINSANGYIAGTVSLETHEHNVAIWWAKSEEENIDKEVAKVVFKHFYEQMLKHNAEMKAMDEDDISESIPELEER
jgi:hypothetical protein